MNKFVTATLFIAAGTFMSIIFSKEFLVVMLAITGTWFVSKHICAAARK